MQRQRNGFIKKRLEGMRKNVVEDSSRSSSRVRSRESTFRSSSRSSSRPSTASGNNSREREVEGLREELRKTTDELETARVLSSAEVSDLRLVVKMQQEELARVKSASGLGSQSERGRIPAAAASGEAEVGNFVSRVRSRVDLLYQNSTSIDKEFSEL
jgi:hypothetical protein